MWKVELSEFPELKPYQHLSDVVDVGAARPVTHRGSNGFWSRLQEGNLGRTPGFRADVAEHVEATSVAAELIAS